MHAVLDEVRLYNCAINQQEVEALCSTCTVTNKLNITTRIDLYNNQILFSQTTDITHLLWKISNPVIGLPNSIGVNPRTAYIAKMQGASLPSMLYQSATVGTPP